MQSSPPQTTSRDGLWQRLVGLGFRLLYTEMAGSYDLVAWTVSLGQWRAWGRSALPYLKGERVLELGHGPGHLLAALAGEGRRVVGLDPSPQMARLAQRRLRRELGRTAARAGLAVPVLQGRAQALPFPTGSFDSVLATFPTSYMVDPATLAEAARVLSPGGRLVVVWGAHLRGRDPLTRGVEWLYRITGQRESTDAHAWEALFNAAGLIARSVQVDMRRSRVVLWVAERPTRRDRD